MPKIDSYRAAARLLGVSASRIAQWVKSGQLTTPPWTAAELRRGTKTARPRIRSPHGDPNRWRAGCNCIPCRTAHNTESRTTRREQRLASINHVWPTFLHDLRSGSSYAEACAEAGLPPASLRSMIRHSSTHVDDLNEALDAGRDPTLTHGTPGSYRRGCRCTDCYHYRRKN